MVANQTDSFKLENRLIVKFLLTENCKQCKIYWRMCHVYVETRFIKRKYSQIGSTLVGHYEAQLKESIKWKQINSPVKKKFLAQQSIKKVMLTVFLDMKGPITFNLFQKKGLVINSGSYCQLWKQNSPHLLNDSYIIAHSSIRTF